MAMRRSGRRLAVESLEERRLLSMSPHVGPSTVFYDYVEDGTLKGGRIEVDPANPHLAAVGSTKAAAAWNVATVVDNGPTDNRIDLVLVGDGYTVNEMGTYQSHVSSLLPTFFGEFPLSAYSTYFNVHRVDVISIESGVDGDPDEGIERDTALDMGFWCSDTERLLCVNVSKALAAANDAPDVEQVLALANTSKYGGAGYGGSNLGTVSGANSAAVQVALHEFGHSFADLADEYDYGEDPDYTGPEPRDANVSIYDEVAMAAGSRKWYRWLDEPNVGTFEGAMYRETGVYRPTSNSKMRNLNRPFEQVNVEQFLFSIYETVRPIDDATEPGTYDQSTTFFVDPLDPTTHSLDVQWFLDDEPIPGAVGSTLDPSTLGLAPGSYRLMVEVVDNTDLVRDESFRTNRMTDERTWTLIQTITTGRIQGTVWNDLDGDGTIDEEPGIDGVTVTLYDADGNVLDGQVTTGGGAYLFDDVPVGAYRVGVDYGTISLVDFVPTRGLNPQVVEFEAGEEPIVNFGFREHVGPLIVTTVDDVDNGDYTVDDLGLREALRSAAIRAGDDVIRFDDSLDDAIFALDPALGQLDIDSNVAIQGSGGQSITMRDADTLLAVSGDVTATLSRLAIRDSDFPADLAESWGTIYNAGTLTLDEFTIANNRTLTSIIINMGQLTINRSAIFGNFADSYYGAGPMNYGTMTIRNTTISGNSSGGAGAGLVNAGELTITNATIVSNAGAEGGPSGVFIQAGTTTLYNTIVAGNTPGDVGGWGSLDPASSHNLIGGDPKLAPLADNGGLTMTHAPLVGSPTIDAGSNDRAVDAGLSADQRGADRFLDGDADGTATVDVGAFELVSEVVVSAAVVDRRIFYNNSVWDGSDDAANEADDGAIAPDKEALRLGTTQTSANYTNYAKGINGIMVDIDGLARAMDLSAADDFAFRVGNDNDPGGWTIAPAPRPLTVRQGAGIDGSDRVTITWPDNAIENQWLQVIVRTTENTGLDEADVFYFGNAIAEAGDQVINTIVNATDEIVARNYQHGAANPAQIDDPYDYDRDGLVNGTDQIIARNHQTNPLTMLRKITAPAADAVLQQASEPKTHLPEASPIDPDWLFEFEWMNSKDRTDAKNVKQTEIPWLLLEL